jgi:hypothetical protein
MKKKAQEEKRIYVILPLTVQVPRGRTKADRHIRIPAGMAAAQAVHVTRKMECEDDEFEPGKYQEITTITLSVRNSKEMHLIYQLLEDKILDEGAKYRIYTFYDRNAVLYGRGKKVLTAICVTPMTASAVDAAIGHLELY